MPENAIPIEEQAAWHAFPRKCLPGLCSPPGSQLCCVFREGIHTTVAGSTSVFCRRCGRTSTRTTNQLIGWRNPINTKIDV
jgi:hypothetical protein